MDSAYPIIMNRDEVANFVLESLPDAGKARMSVWRALLRSSLCLFEVPVFPFPCLELM